MDIYGSNAFGDIGSVIDNYSQSSYDKPLLFQEYGCLGWWETDWSNYTNEERAQDYLIHWNTLKGESLGGYAFTWQDKSENGYHGWGIVDSDRSPRPQFNMLTGHYCYSVKGLTWLPLLLND